MTDEIIKIINLTKKFGKKIILNNINLNVNSGEILGIIGMSGSGKTTLLNCMIGFLQPEIGDIQFKIEHLLNFRNDTNQFRSVFTNENVVKSIFGFATQSPSVYSKLTCYENLQYFGKLYNLPYTIRKTNITILLKLMELYDAKDLRAESLSGGMRKRLDIACSLIHDPKVLILDEPTADLDPLLRKQMWRLIQEINKKGTTIIITSHFLDELEKNCNRVSILHDTKLVVTGNPDDIKSSYSKEQDIILNLESKNYKPLISKFFKGDITDKIKSTSQKKGKLIITTSDSEAVVRRIFDYLNQNKDKLVDIIIQDPTLEKVLETITSKERVDLKEYKTVTR